MRCLVEVVVVVVVCLGAISFVLLTALIFKMREDGL